MSVATRTMSTIPTRTQSRRKPGSYPNRTNLTVLPTSNAGTLATMSAGVVRGRLLDPSETPATGETIAEVLRIGIVVVEQILSGEVEGPLDYLQEQDEWVVVLRGTAVLEVGGQRVDLGAGDWVLLPAHVPHRLVGVEPGTNWLGVHVHPEPRARA